VASSRLASNVWRPVRPGSHVCSPPSSGHSPLGSGAAVAQTFIASPSMALRPVGHNTGCEPRALGRLKPPQLATHRLHHACLHLHRPLRGGPGLTCSTPLPSRGVGLTASNRRQRTDRVLIKRDGLCANDTRCTFSLTALKTSTTLVLTRSHGGGSCAAIAQEHADAKGTLRLDRETTSAVVQSRDGLPSPISPPLPVQMPARHAPVSSEAGGMRMTAIRTRHPRGVRLLRGGSSPAAHGNPPSRRCRDAARWPTGP
jgi:hypothetical protein